MSKKVNLKKLKLDEGHETIWHPDSKLVFKSPTDKVVVGRYVDGNFIELDSETLELCEVWKFKPDMSLIEESAEQSGDDVEDRDEVIVPERKVTEPPKSELKVVTEPPKELPKGVIENKSFDDKYFEQHRLVIGKEEESTSKDEFELSLETILSSYRKLKRELMETKDQLNLKDEEIKQLKNKFNLMKQMFQ